MKFRICCIFFILFQAYAYAGGGMWIPLLVEQQVFPAMQQAGCKLTPQQIYDAQNACLKDAIVKIGEGCSGGFISDKGMIITNFHCVEYFINQNSTIEHNYLQNGFWAQSNSEELKASGLSVELLLEITDVTNKIVPFVPINIPYAESEKMIQTMMDSITKSYGNGLPYSYSIESFYAGNQYFMFKTIRYTDVRLVGFPPLEVATFGIVTVAAPLFGAFASTVLKL